MAAKATLHLSAVLNVKNAQLIVIGRATSCVFTSRLIRNQQAQINPKATVTPSAHVIHSPTLSIRGSANLRPNSFAPITPVNATVMLRGFAINPVPLATIFPRATGRFNASLLGTPLVTFNGRATFSPSAHVIHSPTLQIAGRATATLHGVSLGTGPINATVLMAGHASVRESAFLIHNAAVSIQAGNFAGVTPVLGSVAIRGRATDAFSAQLIHNVTLGIAGRTTGRFVGGIVGQTVFNGAVQIAGRANLRASVPIVPVPSQVQVAGTATVRPLATVLRALLAVVSVQGRANFSPAGFVVGAFNVNGVAHIAGTARLTLSPKVTYNAIDQIGGTASLFLIASLVQRAAVSIQGRASFTPQVPKQSLVWISANTLQYKVWQYKMETMARVLGTSWTVTSSGLSFQSIAVELVSTDAGWGS